VPYVVITTSYLSSVVEVFLALIKQWEAEIKDKVETSHKLRVCLYHGTTREKVPYVVITTSYLSSVVEVFSRVVP
jgi:hypothetical protein